MIQPAAATAPIQAGKAPLTVCAGAVTEVGVGISTVGLPTEMVVEGNTAYSSVSVFVFHQGTRTSGSVHEPEPLATKASLRVRFPRKPSVRSI